MHRRLLPSAALLLAAVLGCAGCTTAAPDPSPAPTRASASETPSVTPSALVVPARLPGEIARDVVTPGKHVGVADDVPKGVTRFAVHLACSGPAGSRMRWSVQDGKAQPFGPSGDWTCSEGAGVAQDDGGSAIPALLQVTIDPDPGVTVGWAIVTDAEKG